MHLTIFNLTWLPAFNLQFCNIEYTLKVKGINTILMIKKLLVGNLDSEK